MTSYEPASKTVEVMRDALLEEFEELHDLRDAGANISLSMAFSAEKKDGSIPPAIKWHGRQALGLAKIINLQDRTHGAADGRVTLDKRFWDAAPVQEQRALLFHELYHFEVVRDDAGAVAEDDFGRPKLKMRQHSIEIGWFTATARYFGKASQECQQFRAIVERDGQLLLPSVFGNEIAHGGDTLTLTGKDGEQVTIPAEDLARVHAEVTRQIAGAVA